ncbi:MAG: prephenate dehydrogenase [Anaerolineae bacterium]
MRKLVNSRVTVVGLGLMGGSLAGALRGRCRTVVGVTRRAETVEAALAHALVDQGTTDLADGVREADVVVLATPVRTILRLLAEIGPLLPEGCLLMDVGSTKMQIVAQMAALPDHVQPLGGHPMCGKEVAGIAAADPALYRGQTFVLTPLSRTSKAALALACALVEAVGARPLLLEAGRHDRLVAATSHLSYLLACALVGVVDQVAPADPAVWRVAAGGFRDTSRLAASDVTMVLDILLTNREGVVEALRAGEAQLRNLAHLVESGDEEGLRTVLTAIRERRMKM